MIMPDHDKEKEGRREESGSGTATAKPKRSTKKSPQTKPPQQLPPWKVLLHNDDKNDMIFVIHTVMELTPLKEQEAKLRTRGSQRYRGGPAPCHAQGARGVIPGPIRIQGFDGHH